MGKLLSKIMLSSSSCQMSFAKLFTLSYDIHYNKIAGLETEEAIESFITFKEKK